METEAAAVVWPQPGPPGPLEAGRGWERRSLEPPEGARAGAFGPGLLGPELEAATSLF